jgi:neopullulanase
MKKIWFTLVLLISVFHLIAQDIKLQRVEPGNWWAGMRSPELQLMVYGENISAAGVSLEYPGVQLVSVSRVHNPNYLFIDLKLEKDVKPGIFDIRFSIGGREAATWKYELMEREEGSADRQGFNSSDVIYLITPDRFANGNPQNDWVEGMKEKPDRSNRNGRHGGDIRGSSIRSIIFKKWVSQPCGSTLCLRTT